jgi:hypothetical protein
VKTIAIVTLCLAAAVPARADTTTTTTAERAAERRRVNAALADLEAREPALAEVRSAALRYAGLGESPASGWSRRARAAALLPTLTLRARVGSGQDEGRTRQSTGTERLDVGSDHDRVYEARAVWELDRLVFDDAEIRAAQTAQRLHQARLQLVAQVTAVFHQRRRLQLEDILDRTDDPAAAALRALEIAELTAQLDALTDGYFSRYARRRFDPPGEPDR